MNAGSTLTAIGKPEIPVYKGADKPLVRPAVHADAIHGESGLAGTDLLPPPKVPANLDVPAVDAMYQALMGTAKNTAWLVATGTLTNVAMLIAKFPDVVDHIKGLSIMGGAIGMMADGLFSDAPMGKVGSKERYGNWTPYGEFNVVADPEAAASIFNTPALAAKTTLIPLDVSHQVLANKKVQSLLKHGKNPSPACSAQPSTMRKMFVELLYFFAETYATVFGLTDGPPLHDPIALAAIFDDTPHAIPFYYHKKGEEGKNVREERFHVLVKTEGTHEEAMLGTKETGRTVATLLPEGHPGVKIPRSLNVANFWSTIEDCMEMADKKNAQDTNANGNGQVNGNGKA